MYCPECGSKLESNANFCEKCGEKIEVDSENSKFCKYCGEKINADAEICPECGARLENAIRSNSKKTINSLSSSISIFLRSKYFKILILIIIILLLVVSAPKIIDTLTPYKDVDSTYISNPVPFEKVRFIGEYMGKTDDNGVYGYLVYHPGATYDVMKVDDQYIFIRDNDLGMKLNKGDMVQLEGKFSDGGKASKEFNEKALDAYWFAPDDYEIIK